MIYKLTTNKLRSKLHAQILRKKLSRLNLLAPCAVFILFNFITGYYLTTYSIYNGDFLGIPVEHSNFEVWKYACIASMPYVVLYFIILKIRPCKINPIKLPVHFVLFSIFILIISLILTLSYGVGIVGAQIYQAQTFLKPLIVVVNRIDPIILAGIIILSPCVKNPTALLAASLMLMLTIYRSSLQYLPFTLMLLYYRFMSFDENIKNNKCKKIIILIIFCLITVLIVNYSQELFKYRDSLRNFEPSEMQLKEFIFGRLIGRLSNLSALLIFELRNDIFNQNISELDSLAYLVDTLKYFWGGFTPKMGISHYDYFTSMLDPNAIGFYAMQTGVLPAMGLSLMKSPVVLTFDIFLTCFYIYCTVRLSTYFLGERGKYLAMSLLIFAILSGAPSQFSLPSINLFIIFIVFNIIKYIAKVNGQNK